VNPSVAPGHRFKKIAVAALAQDPKARRMAEDALVDRIKRSEAVPLYELVPELETADIVQVKAHLREAGVDGVVVMRMTGVDQKVDGVPGSYPQPYYGFSGYWGWAYPKAYSPVYQETDTAVQMETNVYSLADDRLIYSARSQTFNPVNTSGLVGEIAAAIVADLKKRGLIP
jgi:hypothetical protein